MDNETYEDLKADQLPEPEDKELEEDDFFLKEAKKLARSNHAKK